MFPSQCTAWNTASTPWINAKGMTSEYLIDWEADVSLEKINLLTWKMVLMEFLDLQSQNPIGGWKDPGP